MHLSLTLLALSYNLHGFILLFYLRTIYTDTAINITIWFTVHLITPPYLALLDPLVKKKYSNKGQVSF